MKKPSIPSIDNEEAVISWFLKYDEKINDFFVNPMYFEKAKNEIHDNLIVNNDAHQLESFLKEVSDFYFNKVMAAIASLHEKNEEIPGDLLIMESVLAAKMRILGYFLLKKYNIQPE